MALDEKLEGKDIFARYNSPDVDDAEKRRNRYNVGNIAMKVMAIYAQFGFLYNMTIGFMNAGISLSGDANNPVLNYDLTESMQYFGAGVGLFFLGAGLYYSAKYLSRKYDEKRELLNLLIGKREEKRLDYFLKKEVEGLE